MAEITSDDRKEAMARFIETKPHTFQAHYMDALERVKTPGEFGQLAETRWAEIDDSCNLVGVYIAHHEDHIDFTPAECRKLAFELLVLADLAERQANSGEAG